VGDDLHRKRVQYEVGGREYTLTVKARIKPGLLKVRLGVHRMATYEYKCPKEGCGAQIEVSKPIALFDQEEKCPACGTVLERQFSTSTSFHLKGTGWYKTDYTVHGGAHMEGRKKK
jgi:putative FmdB family regulatory protein